MAELRRVWVTEVHNFGGFFGGDTVTLSAVPWPDGEEETLTIDEKALQNIVARHNVAPEMLLELECAGERIDRAWLLAARDRATMNEALRATPPPSLDAPRIRAYRCQTCDLWVVGAPDASAGEQRCGMCQQPLV
jgi:hypothetical protein